LWTPSRSLHRARSRAPPACRDRARDRLCDGGWWFFIVFVVFVVALELFVTFEVFVAFVV
jgi:hypothetical protein